MKYVRPSKLESQPEQWISLRSSAFIEIEFMYIAARFAASTETRMGFRKLWIYMSEN